MSSIFFNRLDSYEDFGLSIENIPSFPSANPSYEKINVPDSDGSLNIFNGYPDISLAFNFVFKAKEDFFQKKSKIINWLNSKTSAQLIYSKDKPRYYKVKDTEISEFKTTSQIVRRFTCKFSVEAFAYLVEGREVLELSNPTTLYNEQATYNSNPIITIYGNGPTTLTINNRAFSITEIGLSITVDSDVQEVYNGKGKYMIGEFPTLEPGENSISWTGNVTKIEIVPNWRCLS